jgi:hypothetical protein
MKQLIYIASPYTQGDVAVNVATQLDAAHRIMDAGHLPFAPLLSHFLHLHRARPYEDWVQLDLDLLRKMDALLRLPGESSGADGEVKRAIELGITVLFGWEEFEEWRQEWSHDWHDALQPITPGDIHPVCECEVYQTCSKCRI